MLNLEAAEKDAESWQGNISDIKAVLRKNCENLRVALKVVGGSPLSILGLPKLFT